jgi:hypothetical protein
MQAEILYEINSSWRKILLIMEFIAGIAIGILSFVIFKYQVDLDIWLFAFPALSLALIIGSFTRTVCVSIHLREEDEILSIYKIVLFRNKQLDIELNALKVQLKKVPSGIFKKVRLEIYDDKKKIQELVGALETKEKLIEMYELLESMGKSKK